jgi:hypothetical protein
MACAVCGAFIEEAVRVRVTGEEEEKQANTVTHLTTL